MMDRAFILICATLLLLASNARSDEVTCGDLLASIGRVLTDLPDQGTEEEHVDFRYCQPAEVHHFKRDPIAAAAAVPLTSSDQLVGTWFGDDVYAAFAGIEIPVFEYLVISEGERPGVVTLQQHVARPLDIAEWVSSNDEGQPSLELPITGLQPMIGEMQASLDDRAVLWATRTRYYDVPLATAQGNDLAMKQRLLSLRPEFGLHVGASGDRLVFTYTDTAFENLDRILTYRRVDPASIETAVQLASLGEISGHLIPCLIVSLEERRPAFIEALKGTSIEDLQAALANLEALRNRQGDLKRHMSALPNDSDDYDRLRQDLSQVYQDLYQATTEGPLEILGEQQTQGFGCPLPY